MSTRFIVVNITALCQMENISDGKRTVNGGLLDVEKVEKMGD